MTPQNGADPFLSEDEATDVARRLPDISEYPRPPDRGSDDRGIPLSLVSYSDSLLMIPVWTPFVVHYSEDTYSEADPVRLLLDSTGDLLVAYCTADNRYLAYSHQDFVERIDNGRISLTRDIV